MASTDSVGRYTLLGELASGGMATVHLGQLRGDAGFQREVAIKRLQPRYASDPDFVAMLLDEARLVSKVRHPQVVQVLDVVSEASGLYVVMKLVRGESLAWLNRTARERGTPLPMPVALAVAIDALHGLHAAHIATDDAGAPLHIVHRDVSPHNLIVGADGVARVLDFGVAKAVGRSSATEDGQIKGKLAYMPPEQALGREVDARSDVYALAIVLWETLSGRRMFEASSQIELMRLASAGVSAERARLPDVDSRLQAALMRGLSLDPAARFQTAQAFADALEDLGLTASRSEVGALVKQLAAERLAMISTIVNRAEPVALVSHAPPGGEATASAIAVSVEVSEVAPPRRRTGVWVAVGVAAVLAVAAAVASRRDEAEPPPPAPPVAPVAVVEPEPVVAPVVAAPEPEVKPAEPERAPERPASKKRRVRNSKATSEACAQPYELDANGNPRFKRECLK